MQVCFYQIDVILSAFKVVLWSELPEHKVHLWRTGRCLITHTRTQTPGAAASPPVYLNSVLHARPSLSFPWQASGWCCLWKLLKTKTYAPLWWSGLNILFWMLFKACFNKGLCPWALDKIQCNMKTDVVHLTLSPVQLPVYCFSLKYIIAEVWFHSLCQIQNNRFCVAFGKETAPRTKTAVVSAAGPFLPGMVLKSLYFLLCCLTSSFLFSNTVAVFLMVMIPSAVFAFWHKPLEEGSSFLNPWASTSSIT